MTICLVRFRIVPLLAVSHSHFDSINVAKFSVISELSRFVNINCRMEESTLKELQITF